MLLQFLTNLDGKVLLFFQEYLRFNWLTPVIKFITRLGNETMIWVVLAVIMLCFKRHRKTGSAMAVTLVIGYLISELILNHLVIRAHPYEAISGLTGLIVPNEISSFPSWHTVSAIGASFVFMKDTPRYLGITAFVLAILIAVSRLYLGVAYPTDILVGAIIGLFSAFSAKYIIKT